MIKHCDLKLLTHNEKFIYLISAKIILMRNEHYFH